MLLHDLPTVRLSDAIIKLEEWSLIVAFAQNTGPERSELKKKHFTVERRLIWVEDLGCARRDLPMPYMKARSNRVLSYGELDFTRFLLLRNDFHEKKFHEINLFASHQTNSLSETQGNFGWFPTVTADWMHSFYSGADVSDLAPWVTASPGFYILRIWFYVVWNAMLRRKMHSY